MSMMADDVLQQLFVDGPVWDGNLVSKQQRDVLVAYEFAARHEGGWNYLTHAGVGLASRRGMHAPTDSEWYRKASKQ